MHIRSWLLVVAVLLGCGADGDDGDDGESVDLEQLASGSSACPSGGVRVSVGGMSQAICNGERGASGMAGAQGAEGGGALVPQTITACVSTTTLPTSRVVAGLTYKQVTFSDGSAFVSCSAVTTRLVSTSHSDLYAGWQQGALTGSCIVTSDASGEPSDGWWDFRMVDGRPRATYHDPGTGDDLATLIFPLSDCPTAARPQ